LIRRGVDAFFMRRARFYRQDLRCDFYSGIVINQPELRIAASGESVPPPAMTPRLDRRPLLSPASSSALPLPQSERVALTVRIDTLDALKVRLALHRELGDRIGVYVLSVDHAHAQSTLQLQCARHELGDLMHAVMCGLPQAEFGAVRPASAITVQ